MKENHMNNITDQYKKALAVVMETNRELKKLRARINASNDKSSRDASAINQKLSEDLKNIEQNKNVINAYINIAKTHSKTNVPSVVPLSFDKGKLTRLNVQLSSGNPDDPKAAQLYTEATGQLLYLQDEENRLKDHAANDLQQIRDAARDHIDRIQFEINANNSKLSAFFRSDEYRDFISRIVSVNNIFTNVNTSKPGCKLPKGVISIGSVLNPFPIPYECSRDVMRLSSGLYDPENHTICMPMLLSIQRGVLIAEYENSSECDILGGMQNIILSYIRYSGSDKVKIIYCDPIRFNASALGSLSRLCEGPGSGIVDAPTSKDGIHRIVERSISEITDYSQMGTRDHTLPQGSLFIFHDFPQSYDAQTIERIKQLCANARHYGIMVFLTHNTSSRYYAGSDVLSYLQSFAVLIRAQHGLFSFVEPESPAKTYFRWYSAPSQIPADIEDRYIVNRPVIDLGNEYKNRAGLTCPEYSKGNRAIYGIPYGVSEEGQITCLDFEDEKYATFICGASRSGKSTLLHAIIAGLIKEKHPDDIELWLIDFKMTEFSRYTDHLPPHIRYIILDESPELIYDIIDRLTKLMKRRKNIFMGNWDKLYEVPSERYMPAIFVVIDEFSIMSKVLADSVFLAKEDYRHKLEELLGEGAAVGFHFIFASQSFSEGTRGLSDYSKQQVQQRIAMKTEYNEIKNTMGLKVLTEYDEEIMAQLPKYYALTAASTIEHGAYLRKSKVLNISKRDSMEFADEINDLVTAAPVFQPDDPTVYVSKKPMILNGNTYKSYLSLKDEIYSCIKRMEAAWLEEEATAIFFGEPSRLDPVYPTILVNEYSENILMITGSGELHPAAAVLLSMLESLKIQDCPVTMWTSGKAPIYRIMKSIRKLPADVITEAKEVCAAIARLKEKIRRKEEGGGLYLLAGLESVLLDMKFGQYQQDRQDSAFSATYERRAPGELDIISQMNMGMVVSSNEDRNDSSASNSDAAQHDISDTNMYDARDDLKFILAQGPRLGYHFFVVLRSVSDLDHRAMDLEYFKHRILFRAPKAESGIVVDAYNADLIARLPPHSFRYCNGLDSLSLRPLLHPGLTWDGWEMQGDTVVKEKHEEYLL